MRRAARAFGLLATSTPALAKLGCTDALEGCCPVLLAGTDCDMIPFMVSCRTTPRPWGKVYSLAMPRTASPRGTERPTDRGAPARLPRRTHFRLTPAPVCLSTRVQNMMEGLQCLAPTEQQCHQMMVECVCPINSQPIDGWDTPCAPKPEDVYRLDGATFLCKTCDEHLVSVGPPAGGTYSAGDFG